MFKQEDEILKIRKWLRAKDAEHNKDEVIWLNFVFISYFKAKKFEGTVRYSNPTFQTSFSLYSSNKRLVEKRISWNHPVVHTQDLKISLIKINSQNAELSTQWMENTLLMRTTKLMWIRGCQQNMIHQDRPLE